MFTLRDLDVVCTGAKTVTMVLYYCVALFCEPTTVSHRCFKRRPNDKEHE